jgi:hypothetical protein
MQISPSVLNANLADLAAEVRRVSAAADWVHLDVMDNHFVPNLTFGLPVVESLLRQIDLPADCHLMIADPDKWAPGFAEAGMATSPSTSRRRDVPRPWPGFALPERVADSSGTPIQCSRAWCPST